MEDQGQEMGQGSDMTQERTHGHSKQGRHLWLSVGLRVSSPLPHPHRPTALSATENPNPPPACPPQWHNILKPKCCAPISCHVRQLEAALAKGHLINMFFYAVSRTRPRHLLKSVLWHALHQSLRSWVTQSLDCSSESAAKLKRSTATSAPHGPVMSGTGGRWRETGVQIRQPGARQAHFTTPWLRLMSTCLLQIRNLQPQRVPKPSFYFS